MKAKINLPNIKSYLQGNWRSVLLEYYPDGLPKHLEEQYYWRIQQVQEKSPECLKGKCKICSCDTPELFMSDKACEGECYPEMKSKEDWNKWKKSYHTEDDQIELSPEGLNFSTILETEYEVGYDDAPGIKGQKFKIKLSKDQFFGSIPIITIPEDANLADLLQANPTLTKEELLYWLPEFKDK